MHSSSHSPKPQRCPMNEFVVEGDTYFLVRSPRARSRVYTYMSSCAPELQRYPKRARPVYFARKITYPSVCVCVCCARDYIPIVEI